MSPRTRLAKLPFGQVNQFEPTNYARLGLPIAIALARLHAALRSQHQGQGPRIVIDLPTHTTGTPGQRDRRLSQTSTDMGGLHERYPASQRTNKHALSGLDGWAASWR